MNEEKLKRANEIQRELEQLRAKSLNLGSNIVSREKGIPFFPKFLKLFRKDEPRERKQSYSSGIWYWTINAKEEQLIRLDKEDIELLKELTDKRIDNLQKEFENL